jgi:hypothetical protein
MERISNFNIGDKVARHHRRVMAKRGLAAAVKGAAQVRANGRLLVTLPLIDGGTATYEAHPCTTWRFDEVANGLKHPATSTEVTPADRAHQALNVLLAIVGDAESRVRVAEPDNTNTAVN